ncbi:MAG: XTP/dITP diphosphohydrolase [Thermoleophilaceae bacterium]|nr:XTP/dITP diphosphohydrolase [Thermoleophilaceae bacterium]
MELLLATRNAHKLVEFRRLLAPHTVLALPEGIELPPEDGDSFRANAIVKAQAAAEAAGRPALADDSGISTVFLGGAPGIYSARYAGEGATDEANLEKLLRSIPRDGDRRASYRCALAWAVPGGETEVFEERCDGLIDHDVRGGGGFGYDPAFVPFELADDRTMAELSAEEKDAISHRGRAARAFLEWLDGNGGAT